MPVPDLSELISSSSSLLNYQNNDSGHVSTNNSDNETDMDNDNNIEDEDINEAEEKLET